MTEGILLSTAYFAPIQYFARVLLHSKIYIEQFEHFTKQTYRNRCTILGSNGPISLVIPVVKGRGPKIQMRDMKISYDEDWQRNHWRTIFSVYNSSPYFEYYEHELLPFFTKKWNYLLEYNEAIHKTICEFCELNPETELTCGFEEVPESTLNFREVISPKNKTVTDKQFIPHKYTQVFTEKFGFVPNLSILDLLFNEGPNSYTILYKSAKSNVP